MNLRVICLQVAGLSISALGLLAGELSTPVRHLIQDFPWHRQMNGLFCGDGALESVFDYWGPDLPQKAIANVARTSSIGTWTFDLRRAGHFSRRSAAQGRFFPHDVPIAGFRERPIGYATFSHAAPVGEPWFTELKALLAADIPVTLLMLFAPDGTGGGHYRVAVGYDDALGVIYFCDPWGRDMRYLPGTEGLVAWTYDEVAVGWNYVAYGTTQPYWGVAILPWTVEVSATPVSATQATVTARITYPCPAPFDPSEYAATAAAATLWVPSGVEVTGPVSQAIGGGHLGAGQSATVTWNLRSSSPFAGQPVWVQASGIISGSVPEAPWTGGYVAYPAYDYTDEIGGTGVGPL